MLKPREQGSGRDTYEFDPGISSSRDLEGYSSTGIQISSKATQVKKCSLNKGTEFFQKI